MRFKSRKVCISPIENKNQGKFKSPLKHSKTILHPTIRIACFFLIVAGLALDKQRLFILIIPITYLLYTVDRTFVSVRIALKQLRWLLLSLFILHLCFNNLDFLTGLISATEQMITVLLIFFTAFVLVRFTPTPDLIAALQWWLSPLKWIGFPIDRLTVRIALILDTVQKVQTLYAENASPHSSAVSDKMANLLIQVMHHAETVSLPVLEIPILTSPAWWQWLYPITLLVLMSIN